MSSTISVCNQKGGVGKTTTALNLATYVALEGYKALLIDIDPQGNATSGVGIDKTALKSTIYNVLVEDYPIEKAIKNTEIEKLKIIPANLDLTGSSMELLSMFNRERKLSTAISNIESKFDLIFIDCPPSLGILTINALTTSGSILIPVQCEYYALEGISQLLKTIQLVSERLNPNLEIEGFLLTMADKRTKLTEEVIEEARSFFKDKLYKTIIPRNIKLGEAPSFGKPIALYDNDCMGARKYHEFMKEFLNKRGILSKDVPRGTSSEQEKENKRKRKDFHNSDF